MVFLLAFFLDFFEIAFIVVPLLAPVAYKLGIDPVWFGVMLAVNMQTAFMHPPFGFALFYLKSVAPKSIRTADIYWGAIPFLVIQLVMVAWCWPSRRWCCATPRPTPAASPKSPSRSTPTPITCRPSGANPGAGNVRKCAIPRTPVRRVPAQTSHSRD
jgi:hypothetical protein